MERYCQALNVAIMAARRAGGLLREELHRPGGPRGAAEHADADEEAERLIREAMLDACPWEYLGEETGRVPGKDRSHVWLVDPNDGTSSFLKGHRGSAVSIAPLRRGEPVLGVVYAFAYPDDEGDMIAWAEGCGPIPRNEVAVPIDTSQPGLERGAVVLLSRGAARRPVENTRCVSPARFRAVPSIAYRLALVAVGEAVAAVSLNGPRDWDYAAGHALLRAAGGVLVDERGEPVRYDHRGVSSTRWCFGGSPEAVAALGKRPWRDVLGGTSRAVVVPTGRPSPGSAMRDSGRLSRAQGCLLGQFAGDSLGSLVEFESAAHIARRYPQGLRDLADGGTWNMLAGQLPGRLRSLCRSDCLCNRDRR